MTRPALRAAGALLFLSTLPALAAQPAVTAATPAAPVATTTPKPVVPPPSPAAQAFTAAVREISAGRASGSYAQWLDTLPRFRFSPVTSALLNKQFGTDRLFTVQRKNTSGGAREYLFSAPARARSNPDGSRFSWDAINGKSSVAADGVTIANQFVVPRLQIEDKTMRVALRAMTASGTSIDGGVAYGDGVVEVANVQMAMKAAGGGNVAMDGLFGKFSITDQGNTASMAYDTGMRTLTVQDERIDDLHLAMHFNGLDKAALEKFNQLGKQMSRQQARLGNLQPKVVYDQVTGPWLRQLGLALTSPGAAMQLDDLSFSYHGSKAQVHGELHLENAAPGDLEQPAALLKKAVGHVDIQVPRTMLLAFAENIARKQQPGADAAALATFTQTIHDGMLRSFVASGYVRVEGDMLVTSIDLRDGAVRINGKPFDMPRPGAPAAIVASPPGTMRARRIAEKCLLPDYPADVVAQDRAFSLALQMRVNPDGSVAGVALARSTGVPDYDGAALAAAAHCTYIPALRGGKPVAVSEVWEIVRAPGSTRP